MNPQDHPPIYLFAGDSLTEGTYGESYVARVAAVLARGEAGLWGRAINAGRSGDTLRSLLARIDDPLRGAEPAWVVLAIGTNDAWSGWLASSSLDGWLWMTYHGMRTGQRHTGDLDRFAALYRTLIDRCRRDAGARVVVCTIGPVGEDLASPVNRQVARLNGAIQRVAGECGVALADVWQRCVDELAAVRVSRHLGSAPWSGALDRRRLRKMSVDELSRQRGLRLTFDGVHLNSRGADLWAATVLGALGRANQCFSPSRPPVVE